ncbi:Ig-like domain-containing protein [Mycobacteroides abscessus]|nr:L,D-transpeptidase family protein [Mycobacteroides abscessus]UEA51012.1 Ig-like domain-containing protein [Mycobacteroides abscessus subsp. abscessus]UEA55772.1 Ig-like domain-containing protein [Mycobacteroides abscessus]
MSAVVTAPATLGHALAASPSGVASVSPTPGQTVGVAMPVTIRFAAPVADRIAAERSIEFSAPKVPAGAFSWVDNATVRFTPREYWPAHSSITVSVHGVSGMKYKFQTGSEVLGIGSISGHTFTVKIDGTVMRTMPASMGKPKHPTPVGSFTALEKQSPVVMDSRTIGIPLNDPEGYKLTVYYAVRVTWGGVYVHSAPWSTGAQGNSNVSHGCINLSPDNASWYYNTVSIGDPIIINA